LGELKFNVLVKPDLFCSFCEKLLAEQVHQEIIRCVANSDYAATLQADTVEAAPMKPGKAQEASKTQDSVQVPSSEKASHNHAKVSKDKQEVTRHTIGGPEAAEYAQSNEARFDPVPRNSGRQGQSQVASWLDNSGTGPSVASVVPPAVTPISSGALGNSGDSVVPRSQSAGPTTSTGSRRGDGSRLPAGSQGLLSLRGSNASSGIGANGSLNVGGNGSLNVGGSSTAGPALGPKTSTTPPAQRSVSVHPLHRTESQKKHPMGKAEDQQSDKTSLGPPARSGHAHPGPPLRRSLPAKTSSGYAPLTRAPSGGSTTNPGISRDMACIGSGGGGPGSTGSGATCTNTGASIPRQPPQNSPRSPGSVSPVLVPHEQQAGHHQHGQALSGTPSVGRPNQASADSNRLRTHSNATEETAHTPNTSHGAQAQTGRSNSHPRVTSAPAGPGRYAVGNSAPSGLGGANRVATPPVPLASGLASHSGPPGQAGPSLSKTQTTSRGPSGSLSGANHQSSTGSGQPTRASSAPRVSGLTAHHHAHATPPGSSSVRTAASQPAGQVGPAGHQSRMPGHHVPGSPSLNSPMAPNQFSSAQPFFSNQPSRPDEGATQAVPRHYGGGASGGSGSGASVVVFPASPTIRGSSPSPSMSMVGASMPMKTGRSTIGSTSGLQRNGSPLGMPGAPASPAGRTMSPAGNVPLGSMSVSGNRTDILSTTRGRSPPPGITGAAAPSTNVRAPRAVTPGQIVKSIQQGTNVPRNSFGGGGPMVMHSHNR
jgi:hypothetical protein